MLFPEDGIGARLFPADLARFLVDYYREKGVDVRPGESVTGLTSRGSGKVIDTKSGARITVDVVVAGIGIVPNTELAEAAGVRIDDGVIVDEHLQSSRPDVFAAGDVANFKVPALGKRTRVEHEDNAVTMGHAAGRS